MKIGIKIHIFGKTYGRNSKVWQTLEGVLSIWRSGLDRQIFFIAKPNFFLL